MSSKSKIRILLLITAIFLLANIALLIFCVWRHEPVRRSMRGERPVNGLSGFLQKDIGFSPDQMKQFDQLRQDHRDRMRPLFDSLRASKSRFYKLISDQAPNDSVMNYSLAAIGERQQAIDREVFQHFKTIRNLCTTDQQARYDSLVQKFLGRMMGPSRRAIPSSQRDSARLQD